MKKNGRGDTSRWADCRRAFIWPMALTLLIITCGCGGDDKSAGQPQQHATGYSADLKKTLEFDDRVLSSEEDGGKLIVNVNEKWEPTDRGNKAWALGGWFDKWQRQHGDAKSGAGLQVIVRYNGKDMDRYSASGYEPVEAKKEN